MCRVTALRQSHRRLADDLLGVNLLESCAGLFQTVDLEAEMEDAVVVLAVWPYVGDVGLPLENGELMSPAESWSCPGATAGLSHLENTTMHVLHRRVYNSH